MKNILLITILLFLNTVCASFDSRIYENNRNIQDAKKRTTKIVKKYNTKTKKVVEKALKSDDIIETKNALKECNEELKTCIDSAVTTTTDFSKTEPLAQELNTSLKIHKFGNKILWYSIGFNILTIIFIIFSILSKTGRLALKTYLGR